MLLLSGVCWHLGRWATAFAIPYLAYSKFDSALASQISGALTFVPMLFGSAVIGPWSDRLGALKATGLGLAAFIAMGLLLSVALAFQALTFLLFPAAATFGLCNTLDLTGRKSLLAQQSVDRVSTLLSAETLLTALCQAIGPLVAGLTLSLAGSSALFSAVTVLGILAVEFLRRANRVNSRSTGRAQRSIRPVSNTQPPRSSPLTPVLLVTVVMNVGYFSHMPLVPAFADRFASGASYAGLLGSASGIGMGLGAAALLTRLRGFPPAGAYYAGSALALFGLLLTSAAPGGSWALGGVCLAGAGAAGFVTMQAVLVAESAAPGQIGSAMGKMSTAIGVLPFSMLTVGALADLTTPAVALGAASSIGLVLLGSVVALYFRPLRRPRVDQG